MGTGPADTSLMELLAEPQPTMTWVCPECGHGSPEPRDQQAHMDAHRQLRQFFREWDAAAAADRRSRRPLVIGCLALVAAIGLAVLALLRVSGGDDAALVARPGVAAPAPEAAVPATPPAAVPAPPAPARPEQSTGGPAARRTPAPAPAAASAGSPTATPTGAPGGIVPPRSAATAPATASPPPVATIPPPAATSPAGLAVHGCLLVVCVELGS